MIYPLRIGLFEPTERWSAPAAPAEADRAGYLRTVSGSLGFVAALRITRDSALVVFAPPRGEPAMVAHIRTHTWDEPLDGVLIVPRPPDAACRRLAFETKGIMSRTTGEAGDVPVCVLAGPAEIFPEGYSYVEVGVRSDRYRFARGDGSVAHVMSALEWFGAVNAHPFAVS